MQTFYSACWRLVSTSLDVDFVPYLCQLFGRHVVGQVSLTNKLFDVFSCYVNDDACALLTVVLPDEPKYCCLQTFKRREIFLADFTPCVRYVGHFAPQHGVRDHRLLGCVSSTRQSRAISVA